MLVESKYFDEEKEAAAKRAEKRREKRKEAEVNKAVAAEQRKRKRAEDPGEDGDESIARSRLRPDQAAASVAESSQAVHNIPVKGGSGSGKVQVEEGRRRALPRVGQPGQCRNTPFQMLSYSDSSVL